MPFIGLMTDFGSKGSHYVASMKGVILKINPKIKIVDISHEISSFSIIEAAYLLKTVYTTFPEGTIFIVVVDPGVGSEREIIALKTKSNYYFIGPNNGIFSGLVEMDSIIECVSVKNKAYFNDPISNTFHGRDIMAPVGAHITKEVPLEEFGRNFDLNHLNKKELEFELFPEENRVRCSIQYIDSFGNIVTNIPIGTSFSFGEFNCIRGTSLLLKDNIDVELSIRKERYKGKIASHFAGIAPNILIFLRGSTDFLEISINQGNAATKLDLHVGEVIELFFEQID